MRTTNKKSHWVPLLLILFIVSGSVTSALGRDLSILTTYPNQAPSDYIVARVYFDSRASLNQLAASLDIWEVNQSGGYLVALLSPGQYSLLERAGFTLIVDQTQTALLHQPLEALPGQSTDSIPGYPCYRTVEETYATITSLEQNYMHLAELIDIGDSWEKFTPDGPAGYEIYALRLTNEDFGELSEKPTFFLMAEIHARELVTAETATRFAEYILANYGIDADITWLLDYYRIYIVPMTNPDGRKHAENGILWRKNTNISNGCINDLEVGTDLNRNHSFHWGGASNDPCSPLYQGPEPVSEPETQTIQNFVLSIMNDQRGSADTDLAPQNTSGIFISLHSYSNLVLWPWGWTDSDAPNHTQLQTLGRRLAYFNNYTPQQANELYLTTGTSDDWAYGELGVAAYTFEMGTAFFQDCAAFETTIHPSNLQSLLYAFKVARLPYINPAGPRVLNVSVIPNAVAPGDVVLLTATADDDLYNSSNGQEPTQAISAARYSIDAPSWFDGSITYPLQPPTGDFNTTREDIEAIIDTSNLADGRHIIFVEAMDVGGNWGVPTAVFLNIGTSGFVVEANPDTIITQNPDTWIAFTLSITNTGIFSDAYDVRAISDWLVEYPLQVGPLGAGENALVAVSVFVPILTPPGTSNETIITFSSQSDPELTRDVAIYTQTGWPNIFIPLVRK